MGFLTKFYKSRIEDKIVRTNIILAISALIIFYSAPLYSTYAKNYIDSSLKSAAISYATLRSLNAGISVIQESSVTFGVGVDGNIAIGQALDPINDAIERFSDMITLSVWTLGAQKALYEVSNTDAVYALIIILAMLSLLIKHEILTKLFIVLIVLRLFIPFSAVVSEYMNEHIFNVKMQKNLKNIKRLTQTPIKVKTNIQTGSIWRSMGQSVENIKQSAIEFVNSVKFYVENSPKIISELIELSILFFTKFFFEFDSPAIIICLYCKKFI